MSAATVGPADWSKFYALQLMFIFSSSVSLLHDNRFLFTPFATLSVVTPTTILNSVSLVSHFPFRPPFAPTIRCSRPDVCSTPLQRVLALPRLRRSACPALMWGATESLEEETIPCMHNTIINCLYNHFSCVSLHQSPPLPFRSVWLSSYALPFCDTREIGFRGREPNLECSRLVGVPLSRPRGKDVDRAPSKSP